MFSFASELLGIFEKFHPNKSLLISLQTCVMGILMKIFHSRSKCGFKFDSNTGWATFSHLKMIQRKGQFFASFVLILLACSGVECWRQWDNGSQMKIRSTETQCGQLPPLEHGSYSSGSDSVGSKRAISCEHAFKIQGNDFVECLPNGRWSLPGECLEIVCPEPNIKNGFTMGVSYTWGSRLEFTCYEGFQLEGSNEIVCQKDSTWTINGACSHHCGFLPEVPNASVKKVHGQSRLIITCHQGYDLIGPREVYCEDHEKWSEAGKCLLLCGSPPTIHRGRISFSNINNGLYPVGTSGRVVCDATNTYVSSTGSSEVTCVEVDGAAQWSQVGTCQRDVCYDPQPVPHSTFTSFSSHENFVNSRKSLQCDSGYEMFGGPSEIMCETNTQWSQSGRCMLSCLKPLLNNIHDRYKIFGFYSRAREITKIHSLGSIPFLEELDRKFCFKKKRKNFVSFILQKGRLGNLLANIQVEETFEFYFHSTVTMGLSQFIVKIN